MIDTSYLKCLKNYPHPTSLPAVFCSILAVFLLATLISYFTGAFTDLSILIIIVVIIVIVSLIGLVYTIKDKILGLGLFGGGVTGQAAQAVATAGQAV